MGCKWEWSYGIFNMKLQVEYIINFSIKYNKKSDY